MNISKEDSRRLELPEFRMHAEGDAPKPLEENAAAVQHFEPDGRTNTAPHVCKECNARFKRLEHLKRHITSFHSGGTVRTHGCQLCGKWYSRRDILLRHQQSCRAIRFDDMPLLQQDLDHNTNIQISSTSGRSCRLCSKLNVKCNGGTPCKKCVDLARDCVYSPDSTEAPEPGLTTIDARYADDLVNRAITEQQFSSTAQSHLTVAEEKALLRERSEGQRMQRESETTNEAANSSVKTSGTVYSTLNLRGSTSEMISCSGGQFPQPTPMWTTRTDSSRASEFVGKRRRYVSKACTNCRDRKVKCSGDHPCNKCAELRLSCVYEAGNKRQRIKKPIDSGSGVHLQEKTQLSTTSITPLNGQGNRFDSILGIQTFISNLEHSCRILKSQLGICVDYHNVGIESTTTSEIDCYYESDDSCTISLPWNEGLSPGATNLLSPIEILNRTVAGAEAMCEEENPSDSRIEGPVDPQSKPITWQNLRRVGHKNIAIVEQETRSDPAGLMNAVDVFFADLNPHYPCLNENQFRHQFQAFLSNSFDTASKADQYQFIALVNLIQAEVRILNEDCQDSVFVPGWVEFCRAESIFDHLLWMGNGNMITIQCLLLKARYLLYIERSDAAYDAMGQAVRLCFKLRLNFQSSWVNCDPFEVAMRQRIFWTIFYLDRNVALNCGAPYLLRESDCKVELPKDLDDKEMYPDSDRPLPAESHERSFGPYLKCAVKWAKLCSEIWDSVFGTNEENPASGEIIALTDARILFAVSEIPIHLLWEREGLDKATKTPHYILRQTAILHLRMNQLRLLLRQQTMLSFHYTNATALACVSIATDTIDTVEAHHTSSVYRPTHRWSSGIYIVGALIPLICIIMKSDSNLETRASAIKAFKKGLSILNQMSPTFSLARHALRRLHRIIGTAKQAIHKFDHAKEACKTSAEFQFETLDPQFWNNFDPDDPDNWQHALGEYAVSQENNSASTQFPLDQSCGVNSEYQSTDIMDKFWLDDDFFNIPSMEISSSDDPNLG